MSHSAHSPDLQLFADSIPGLVFTSKPDGELEWVNRTILAYFGRSLTQLQAWQMTDAVHPEDLPNAVARWNAGVASGLAYEIEQRLRRHDGVYRWFHFRAAPIRDEQGRLVRWYGLVTDIDDLKRAHEALRSSAGDLRMLIDNIPGLVFTMTPTCELELVNLKVVEYFGKSPEELRQWDAIDCVHPEDMPRVVESLRRTIELGEPHEVEQRLRRADGVYRWFKPGGLPLRDGQGRIVRWYCLLTDIDDLKRAEAGLLNVQARFSRAAQLATLSELAASIAHEIKQPLAAVVTTAHACTQWLSSSPPNIERARSSAERIVRDGSSAAEVVSRIRSLFRHAPPKKELLCINDVIDEVVGLMAGDMSDRNVTLRTDLQNGLPSIEADRIQLQQLLANLIRNGIEAMVEVDDRPRGLAISSAHTQDEITVAVSDCGIGIDASEPIFDAFYTTKPHGMGMGLAICRTVVEAHEGRIWTAANKPSGTTVSFALRVSRSTTAD